MDIPILIPAFGTTATALETYNHLDSAIRKHFPENEIIWSYSSRGAKQEIPRQENTNHLSLKDILQQLKARKIYKAVVQSLNLLPGTEFHDLHRTIRSSGLVFAMGMPLLTTPSDYDTFGEILRPTITKKPDNAILLLGHGTTHPSWTAYCCLEMYLRRTFGDRVFVGVLEKFPDSTTLPAEIKARGFSEVCVIPFLLIAGVHFHRDIIGDGQSSWMTRLRNNGLVVETINHGLGLFPDIEALIIRHITEAVKTVEGLT